VPALGGTYLEQDITDLPMVYVWYRPRGGPTSFVVHYLGDRGAPARLVDIEAALDKAAGVDHWLGPRAGHPGAAATFSR
jgi:hypothetical protein